MRKLIFFIFAVVSIFAKSECEFPSDFKNYVKVDTPLAAIGGALPPCNADVSKLPKIYQETVMTYCAIRAEGPGKVEILVKPSALEAFKKRNGQFKDGDTLVMWLKDLKVIFVTTYKNNKPLYGAFTEDGKDVTSKIGSGLHPKDCRTCHSGYSAFCVNGQCGKVINK